jgi:hypothetical protein
MDRCSYFKGLIFCTKCGKKYNKKKNGNLDGFICSGFKNYGKEFCDSKFIHLDELLDDIERHCYLYGKEWKIEKAKLFIWKIEIGEELIIRWKDSRVTKVSHNEIVF